MSNTNNNNKAQQKDMSNLAHYQSLPPLPAVNSSGPDVCSVMRLYLAVWDDLTVSQKELVYYHVQSCAECKKEQRILSRTTQMLQQLPITEPAPHVDDAVMRAIAARRNNRSHTLAPSDVVLPFAPRSRQQRSPWRLAGILAAAALLILAVGLSISLLTAPHLQAFALPANLSWNNYILFSKQTMANAQGQQYEVMAYHNMSVNMVNVETVMPGKIDVVVVADQQKALGMDMMHHVAQWDAQEWVHSQTFFDLNQLRNELNDGSAVYLGKGTFQGKEVYRIRYPDGHVLLLDMHYMPVNILPPSEEAHTPMYDTVQWLLPTQVSASMWDMQVPGNFRMGQLPGHP
ncbi:hypothetical protein [Dictyobacter kobayashii]|uniref:Zinc-finger domain-containing protein n=1 Tax=Dictyobacter kobayashii TaxID=2014872 RepID=A0A402AKB9_9CHLR|nr:hypothetical protein [Dictyobacter kobayashii]GCE19474.1 hypothetical protein KDK_32740 [Dictyobacter kobayashii]